MYSSELSKENNDMLFSLECTVNSNIAYIFAISWVRVRVVPVIKVTVKAIRENVKNFK